MTVRTRRPSPTVSDRYVDSYNPDIVSGDGGHTHYDFNDMAGPEWNGSEIAKILKTVLNLRVDLDRFIQVIQV